MKQPKYKIGQTVWAVYNEKAEENMIKGIVKMSDNDNWLYLFGECYCCPNGVTEPNIYSDKESFIESL